MSFKIPLSFPLTHCSLESPWFSPNALPAALASLNLPPLAAVTTPAEAGGAEAVDDASDGGQGFIVIPGQEDVASAAASNSGVDTPADSTASSAGATSSPANVAIAAPAGGAPSPAVVADPALPNIPGFRVVPVPANTPVEIHGGGGGVTKSFICDGCAKLNTVTIDEGPWYSVTAGLDTGVVESWYVFLSLPIFSPSDYSMSGIALSLLSVVSLMQGTSASTPRRQLFAPTRRPWLRTL